MCTVRSFVLLTASLLVTACASPPGGERPVFGDSVRHMIEAQTYTPGADESRVQGTRAAVAMEAYRQDASDPGEFGKGQIQSD